MYIIPDFPVSPYLRLQYLLLVLTGISSVYLLLVILRPFFHRQRRRPNPQREPSCGLSSSFVEKLPRFKFSEPITRRRSDCVVCLDRFRLGQWCRRLPGCGHVFHRKCVDTWFRKSGTCPICRDRVREEDAQHGGLWRRCSGLRKCYWV